MAGAQAQLDKLYHLVGTAPSVASVGQNSYLEAMLIEAGCANMSVHACDTPPGGNLPRVPFYAKSDFFTKPLSRAGINALLAGIERLRTISGAAGGAGSIGFDALGGAVNRVKPPATAFVHRNALFDAQYYTGWNWPGTAAGRSNQYKWITAYHKSMRPLRQRAGLSELPGPEPDEPGGRHITAPTTNGSRRSRASTTRTSCSRSRRRSPRPSACPATTSRTASKPQAGRCGSSRLRQCGRSEPAGRPS